MFETVMSGFTIFLKKYLELCLEKDILKRHIVGRCLIRVLKQEKI